MPDSSLDQQLAEIKKRMLKVESYMLWCTILGTLRTLLVVVPIVLAIIFVPPVIKKYLPFVSDLVEFSSDLMNRAPRAR